jgi:hypothetical protein
MNEVFAMTLSTADRRSPGHSDTAYSFRRQVQLILAVAGSHATRSEYQRPEPESVIMAA